VGRYRVTHDELLSICDNYTFKDSGEPVRALRAVVELHKPSEDSDEFKNIGCEACGFNSEYMQYIQKYPCPTIQAIEEELK